jgi:DNA replication protein DnaC
MGYDRYLLGLLERESDVRWNHRVERLLRESRLPLEKTLDRFEMKRLPTKAAHQVKALLDGGFLERRENVLAFGNPGSGKTHLLCAIGQALVRQGRKVFFTTCGLLVQELLLAKRNLQLPRMLKRLTKCEALIIDDIGYVHQDRDEMDVLFTLLADRYERGSVLITSNLPFSKWEAIFKDPMVTAAAVDRLVHHSVILELNIGSYRMSAAKKTAAETVA